MFLLLNFVTIADVRHHRQKMLGFKLKQNGFKLVEIKAAGGICCKVYS